MFYLHKAVMKSTEALSEAEIRPAEITYTIVLLIN